MSIILGLSSTISIIISAAVSIVYTLLGGLYSVAYTDIIQLCFIFFSLVRILSSSGNKKRTKQMYAMAKNVELESYRLS